LTQTGLVRAARTKGERKADLFMGERGHLCKKDIPESDLGEGQTVRSSANEKNKTSKQRQYFRRITERVTGRGKMEPGEGKQSVDGHKYIGNLCLGLSKGRDCKKRRPDRPGEGWPKTRRI